MTAFAVKPHFAANINREHSLYKGLLLECPFFKNWGGLRDYSGNKRDGVLTSNGTFPPFGTGARGFQREHTSTSDFEQFGISSFLPLTPNFTAVLGQKKRDATNRASTAFAVNVSSGGGTDGDTGRCGAHVPYNDGTVYFDYGGLSAGTTRLSVAGLSFTNDDIWFFTVGIRGMEIWQNSVKRAGNSSTPSRTNGGTQQFQLGRGNQVFASDLVNYTLLRIYNRQLTVSEIESTVLDPWQIYHDEDEADWIAAATVAHTGNRRRRILCAGRA